MEIKCDENIEGMRLDRFLRRKFKNENLSKIFESIRTGKVKVNNKKQKENYRLKLDDIIEINLLKEEVVEVKKNKSFSKINIDKEKYQDMIFYEDNNYLLINKPSGITVHKGTSNDYGLAEVFKQIMKNDNINFANRIDKDTKGLVLGAKNPKTLRELTEKIRNNELVKKYIVIVHGNIEKKNFEIENFLETQENRVIISDGEKGKYSKTVFKKIKNLDNDYTILEAELLTGRKHQIRVHLSSMGTPILGDKKYGIRDKCKELMLIAYYLKFDDHVFEVDYRKYIEDFFNL